MTVIGIIILTFFTVVGNMFPITTTITVIGGFACKTEAKPTFGLGFASKPPITVILTVIGNKNVIPITAKMTVIRGLHAKKQAISYNGRNNRYRGFCLQNPSRLFWPL